MHNNLVEQIIDSPVNMEIKTQVFSIMNLRVQKNYRRALVSKTLHPSIPKGIIRDKIKRMLLDDYREQFNNLGIFSFDEETGIARVDYNLPYVKDSMLKTMEAQRDQAQSQLNYMSAYVTKLNNTIQEKDLLIKYYQLPFYKRLWIKLRGKINQ